MIFSDLFQGKDIGDVSFQLGTLSMELEKIPQRYKIHLMPTNDNFFSVMQKLLEAIEKDPELQELIFRIKFIDDEGPAQSPRTKRWFPRIVIYADAGKHRAQQLLNIIYGLFKNEPGMDVSLDYNYKLTPLIYFAQGDADSKSYALIDKPELKKYYELPKMIYYSSQEIPPPDAKDHYLRHPETNEILK